MTEEQITLAIIRDTIAQAEQVDRELINAAADEIRDAIKRAGGVGPVALALVGAEFAAK